LRDDVLRRNQFDLLLLAPKFSGNCSVDIRIPAIQRFFEKTVAFSGVAGCLCHENLGPQLQVLESTLKA
jgi:hypothetical protein